MYVQNFSISLIEALRAQLEESIKLSGEQVSQLMEDRRIMLEGLFKTFELQKAVLK